MSNNSNDKLVMELRPDCDPALILRYMQANPRGGSIADIAKVTGLSEHGVRQAMMRFHWFLNISKRHRKGDQYLFQYRPVENSTVIQAVLPPTDGAKLSKPTGKASVETVRPAPPDNTPRSLETDIVMPPAPPIPDWKSKYPYFDPPEWYGHLKSKVLVHNRNVRLAGPPGIGKSVAWEVLASQEFVPLVNINADAGLRARQLIGGMTDTGRFEVAQFAAAVVHGWWAKVDEVNGADPDAILFLNSILAPPYIITIHGRSYPVHPEFRMCVTYNPGLVGTKPLPDSLKDRLYPFKLKFPTETRLKKMLEANGVPTSKPDVQKMMAFALAVSEQRNQRKHKFDITMRRLLDAYTDLLDGLPLMKALENSCINGIDSDVDANVVATILAETLKTGQ